MQKPKPEAKPDLRLEESTLEKIGLRIRLLRKEHGLNQSDLARQLYCSKQALGAWERGEKSPSISTVVKLAIILETSTDYLLTGYQSADATIGERTGLSQKTIDDMEVWANSRFTGELVNFVLSQRVYDGRRHRVGFSNAVEAVAQAVKVGLAEKSLDHDRQMDKGKPVPLGVDAGDGFTIPHSAIIDGLCARAGDIVRRLVAEYVEKEVDRLA